MDLAAFAIGSALSVAALTVAASKRRAHERETKARLDAQRAATDAKSLPFVLASDTNPEHFAVWNLWDLFPDTPSFPSPLLSNTWPRNQNFVGANEETLRVQSLQPHPNSAKPSPQAFLTAGPLERLAWDPATVRVAVVTCGGLCSGLNTVIQSVVHSLTYVYGVPRGNIFGVMNGYRGFYEYPFRTLTPADVANIHTSGGTILGSSRGGFDADRILASIQEHRINIVVIVGGDGTHRGALALTQTAIARGVRISVACIPKASGVCACGRRRSAGTYFIERFYSGVYSAWQFDMRVIGLTAHFHTHTSPPTHTTHPLQTIDNDIGIIDRSFGFDTAVEQAVLPLTCAHTEALAAKNGVGLVKLMGRSSGFIAVQATLASRDVNVCLIPEAPWRLSSLLTFLEARLRSRGHCLIAVAEGSEAEEQREARGVVTLPPHSVRSGAADAPAAAAAAAADVAIMPPAAADGRGVVAPLTPTAASTNSPVNLPPNGHTGLLGLNKPTAVVAGAAAAASSGAGAVAHPATDESGNVVLGDIGTWLKDKIIAHFKSRGIPLNLKFIDPSYVIRASPPIASDSHLCTDLAFNAVHGAMGGKTGFSTG